MPEKIKVLPEYKVRQAQMIQAVRSQTDVSLSFIDDDRLALYQRLVYYGNEELLEANFPVLYEILEDECWDNLIKDYLKNARMATPLYPEIPEYFLNYLQESEALENDLIELAHYEWLELKVSLADVLVEINIPVELNENTQVAINPSLELMEYQYPVHKIGSDHYPLSAETTYLAVYRNDQFEVKFESLSLLTARVLFLLQHEKNLKISDLIQQINTEANRETDQEIFELVQNWIDKQIIVETKSCV